ncbi:MAG TPA: class I SAM-dependent methyltransferase [Bryobacteraceae bacterium]|nr:class I SAM-dependent methyltransferase [Bryobacteraceae bacterium]
MRRNREYDPFASLYAAHWGDEFHAEIIPVLDRLLLKHLPRRAEILDLCCGDGRVTKILARRGFRMTGIDGSERMLSFAKQALPKTEFLLADARNFRLAPRFDAVVSVFDSLNHVLSIDDLARVFRNVFACLKPEGAFVFDLNREEAYTDIWVRPLPIVTPKVVAISLGSYESRDRLATCDITMFQHGGGAWHRSDFRLKQRCHDAAEVLAALSRAGFESEVFDAARDLGMQGEIGFGRDCFIARKPVGPEKNL